MEKNMENERELVEFSLHVEGYFFGGLGFRALICALDLLWDVLATQGYIQGIKWVYKDRDSARGPWFEHFICAIV